MANKQILEDSKDGILHPGFAVFYCKDLDKHLIRRLPIKDEEKQVVLSEFEKMDFHQRLIVYQLNLLEQLLNVRFLRKLKKHWIPL
jgi:hypothetical protein